MIPLFKTSYSFGKSILTLKHPDKVEPNGPDSILKIAKDYQLDHIFIVDDTMGCYEEAKRGLKDMGIGFTFGLRFDCGEEDLKTQSKLVLLTTGNESEEPLIRISSEIFTSDYKNPRISFDRLKEFLLENEGKFVLAVPFYDSFVHNNRLKAAKIHLDFTGLDPVFFVEDNDLLFDDILRKRVLEYAETMRFKTVETRSIYYKSRKDFLAYLTNKCIQNKSKLEKPEMDDMTSDSFCWNRYWKDQKNGE